MKRLLSDDVVLRIGVTQMERGALLMDDRGSIDGIG